LNSHASKVAKLLAARTVAIVGASSDPTKLTGRPIDYMRRFGFSGKIFPVNPSRQTIQGLQSYPSLSAIGEAIDVAIVATAANQVCQVVEEGIAAGVGGFVVFSAGFAEIGEEGSAWQSELSALARKHGVPIIGPNCIGIINARSGLLATFASALDHHSLKSGRFGLASQSGALAAYWLGMILQAGGGVSKWISTGNGGDVEISDALSYLVEDEDTSVIGLYIEDLKSPAVFRAAAARAAELGKPILAIRAGRTAAGALATASHTGALAGEDQVYQALFDQYGVIRVRSLTEMVDVASIFLSGMMPSGERTAIITVSGGAGALIADELEEAGLGLAEFSTATTNALREALPHFSKPQNPIDLTATAVVQGDALFENNLRIAVDAPEVDAVIVFIGVLVESVSSHFADKLEATKKRTAKPVIVIWIGAPDAGLNRLRTIDIPVFTDIPAAVAALAHARDFVRARPAVLGQRSIGLSPPGDSETKRSEKVEQLPEWKSKEWLSRETDVTVPGGVLVRRGEDVSLRLKGLRAPFAAKLQSAEMAHKSDHGGVRLKLNDDADVDKAVADLFDLGKKLGIEVDGILVEQMIPYDLELLVGFRRDPRFGPLILVGRGGVEVELEKDVKLGLLPLSADGIASLLRSLRGARLFDGFRGRPKVDVAALAMMLARLAERFVNNESIKEIEINPLVGSSMGFVALDALITLADEEEAAGAFVEKRKPVFVGR
jgi:acetate---CoA ligase (ADP-forming)